MLKWRRIRKAKKFVDIIGGIANIIGNIYWLSTDIYEFKTGKRPNYYED